MHDSALTFGCVLVPPRRALDALDPAPAGPPALRARRIAKIALEDGDVATAARANQILSDTFLLSGSLDRAEQALNGADPSRVAILLALKGDPSAAEALAERCTAAETSHDALCAILLAWIRPQDPDSPGRIDWAFEHARPFLDAASICRLGLVAAVAHHAAGDRDRALHEALRSQAGASEDDRQLEQHSRDLVSRILSSINDERVDQLVRVALELGNEVGQQRVLDRVASCTLRLVGAQRAFVLLGDREHGLSVAASAFEPGHTGQPSLSIAREAIERGRETITHDLGGKSVSESIEAMQLRMVLCIPMADRDGVIGAISADSTAVSTRELEDIAWLIRAFAAHATVAVRHARLLSDESVRTQHAREVVHDVRNIANGMRLGLDELRDLDLPEWATESLRDVMAMNAMLLETVNPLLEPRAAQTIELRLDALVERAAAMLRFDASDLGVEFVLKLEPVEVLAVQGDLARVLANVLGNALKYTPRGGQVRIQVAQKEHVAIVAVADQGPGIAEADLERIFESGAQAEDAKEGFGLGLGICRRIVTNHGGRIKARNGPQGGAIFTVLLPLLPREPPAS